MKSPRLPCKIPCDRVKLHRLPFTQSTRAKSILEFVHIDICGLIDVRSNGGTHYFAIFIDDKTRYIKIVFLKWRSDILTEFKNYQLRVERETGQKIVKLGSDNAKEYVSKEFDNYLESQGIKRQLSTAYTPQQKALRNARIGQLSRWSAQC